MERASRSAAAALLGLVLLATACEAEVSIGTTGLDVDTLEAAIDDELFGNAPDQDHDPVTCPQDPDDEVGSVFVCTTGVQGEQVTVRVTVTDDGADFIREQAILDIDKAKEALAAFLVEQTDVPPAEIDCPDRIVYAPGESFTCTAFDGSGGSIDLEVVVRNVEGDVDFSAA